MVREVIACQLGTTRDVIATRIDRLHVTVLPEPLKVNSLTCRVITCIIHVVSGNNISRVTKGEIIILSLISLFVTIHFLRNNDRGKYIASHLIYTQKTEYSFQS